MGKHGKPKKEEPIPNSRFNGLPFDPLLEPAQKGKDFDQQLRENGGPSREQLEEEARQWD